MSDKNEYVKKLRYHGHSKAPVGEIHVPPVVMTLPQDSCGKWLRESLKDIASDEGISLACLCRRVFSEYVNQTDDHNGYNENGPTEGGWPDYPDGK